VFEVKHSPSKPITRSEDKKLAKEARRARAVPVLVLSHRTEITAPAGGSRQAARREDTESQIRHPRLALKAPREKPQVTCFSQSPA